MPPFEGELLALVPRLRRFSRALARDAADADDLCQIALERALKSKTGWEPGTRLDSWVYRIMRNCWIDETRSRKRASNLFAPDEEASSFVANDNQQSLDHLDLRAALQALPDEQREVVALVLVEGLAYREAAEVLEIPIGTLTSRLARARQTMVARLGEER